MYGNARRPENQRVHHDELHARLYAVECENKRRVSESTEPKMSRWHSERS